MEKIYQFKDIEQKWQKLWEENFPYKTRNLSDKKFYCLDMFPYPSASGLHVGHWKGYVFSDVFARKRLLEGYDVLHPMGWDAFGLPAENDAIKKGLHPKTNTEKNIDNFKKQLKKIGAVYDWSKEISTTDPSYYKWTQWIFVKMFEQGLAYQQMVPVNWCPNCLTGLANEEATGGACDRCGNLVELRPLRQWILKITKYADDLENDLDSLQWPEKVKLMQKHWIGKSFGTEVDFEVVGGNEKLTVFTTRIDTLAGCSFLAIACDHDFVQGLIKLDYSAQVEEFLEASKAMTDLDKMTEKEQVGVFTGSFAKNPLTGQQVPIYLANYVLKNYGTGIVMGVAAHDERDFAFAKKYSLPIVTVVQPKEGFSQEYVSEDGSLQRAYIDQGIIINTPGFDGISAPEAAKEAILKHLSALGLARGVVKYKLRDWVFSRQRYWGEPIPLIHCQGSCGVVAVPENQLPVLLPEVESYQPTGTGQSPLAAISDWVNTTCPKCGGEGQRETNTMPQWAGSCWYFLRYLSPDYQQGLADPKMIEKWMPVDLYVGGIEHAVLHLLYSRFYVKFLNEIGVLNFNEPFKKLFNQGMVCMRSPNSGRVEKMSKSKGNVVDPDEIVEKMGSDTLRLYMLFMGPAELDTEWQTESILGVHNFLKRLWTFFTDSKNISSQNALQPVQKRFHQFLKDFQERVENYKANTAVASVMEFYNDLVKNSWQLDADLGKKFLTCFSIMAPHFSSELLSQLFKADLVAQSWPELDQALAAKDLIELVIQINGKLRATLLIAPNLDQVAIESLAKAEISKWLEGKTIRKAVFVKGRVINFVVG